MVFFAMPRLSEFNEEMRESFGIIVGEGNILSRPDALFVPGGTLSDLWDGLLIGSTTPYCPTKICSWRYDRHKTILRLSTYFGVLSPTLDYTSISVSNGDSRKMSVHGAIGSGEFLFVSSFVTGGGGHDYRNKGNFLNDWNLRVADNREAANALINWLVGSKSWEEATSRSAVTPSRVTDAHIQQAFEIRHAMAEGSMDCETAEEMLTDMAGEAGKDGLAWIMENIPIYDDSTGSWESFGDYASEMAHESDPDSQSRFSADPIGTTLDVVFDDPSPDQILKWLGHE